jgi:hypothetical protein
MFVFEWDENKARGNLKKHGVSFEKAQSVFFDENARIVPDPEHSDNEDRFHLLGISANVRILTVCHCYRQDEKTVRSTQRERPLILKRGIIRSFYEKRI